MSEATRSVLVVEDEPLLRDLLALFLRRDGLAVTLASGAEEALGLFRPGAFALVLLDVRLRGGLDGPGLLRQLQALDPGVRAAFMTGDPDHLDALRALGAAGVFTKPFRAAELVAVGRLAKQGPAEAPRRVAADL
jgi:DNA-binding response OmpR family regulator